MTGTHAEGKTEQNFMGTPPSSVQEAYERNPVSIEWLERSDPGMQIVEKVTVPSVKREIILKNTQTGPIAL